jgi:ubiquinone/menaquinone biosynthesis C-methylase UbiE
MTDRNHRRTLTDAAIATGEEPDAAAVYALGGCPEETARLRRQAIELRPETLALLDRIGLKPGQSAIDLGCGPRGIIDMLYSAVSPGGRVVGLDANPLHVTMAREFAYQHGLADVEIVTGDARHTGLPSDSFDFVHARTLLAPIPEPAEVVAEMARLARPGGLVASQEPDINELVCYPPIPAWDRLCDLFQAGFMRSGANPLIGRRLTELYREVGLTDIEQEVYANTYPIGHTRRTMLPDLIRTLRPMIIDLGLADEQELVDLDRTVRQHLADPDTVEMQHLLFVVWGRKPAVE